MQSPLDGWTTGETHAVRLLDRLSAPIHGGTIRQQDSASSVPCQRVRMVMDQKHTVRHRRLQRTTGNGGTRSQAARRGWDDDRYCFVPCPHRPWLPGVQGCAGMFEPWGEIDNGASREAEPGARWRRKRLLRLISAGSWRL